MKRTFKLARKTALAAVISLGCWVMGNGVNAFADSGASGISQKIKTQNGAVCVMAVGGSSAHGWADPHNRSYLKRAFEGLASQTDAQLVYDDHTIPGAPAASISPARFAGWLAQDKPQVVAISWGLLDDVHNHTPLTTFESTVRNEIRQALNADATVFVVTPPAVSVSTDQLLSQFQRYALAEYSVVASLSSPDVYWFDLHAQTLDWIQGHDQTMTAYCSGTWHPNSAGQALAGRMLLQDMHQTFGNHLSTMIAFGKVNDDVDADVGKGTRA